MMNALISLIIPVYNHAVALRQSLLSLKKQTYRQLEIIIVDDGSTPPLGGCLENHIFHRPHLGAPSARNFGFLQAHGEYVIFWDADTIAKPKMLEKLVKLLQEHPEASFAYSKFKFGWKTMRSQQFIAEDLKRYNYIDTTSLVRCSALPAKPFDENLKRFQDWDLWLTLLEQNKTGVFLPEVLFKKIVRGRKGYSSWLPSFAFKWFGWSKRVKEYEEAKKRVLTKHQLILS